MIFPDNKFIMSEIIRETKADKHGILLQDEVGNTPRREGRKLAGGCARLLLNVGGVRHETHVSTLRNAPNTRLARLAENHLESGCKTEEYFFDRHPAVFNSVIDYYRTGELHVPLEVCGAVVKRELDFWQINQYKIKACCWRHYRSYIDNQRILESFNNSLLKENVNVNLNGLEGWLKIRTRVWLILEHPRTSTTAMVYGITSFLFVMLSIAGFCLETLPDLRPVKNVTKSCDGDETGEPIPNVISSDEALNVVDIICTIFFTLELIFRFIFSPNKIKFVRSAMNIIDLLALVPLYVQVFFMQSDLQACYLNERFVIEVMFILRIIRMFRIFHLVKHYQALKVLVYAIKASIQELLMLFIFLMIGMLVFATMIYYAERTDALTPSDKFNTIPMGFWWAIITMTTVGYGDVFPTRPIGYVVGTACAVSGVLLVALTIPVISNNFSLFYTHVRSRAGVPPEANIPETSLEHIGMEDRRLSNASTITEPFMNGKTQYHENGTHHQVYVPIAKFSESNSMTDIILQRDTSEYQFKRSTSAKAHSDDGVQYQGESII
ncbi:potassium voltage-gated channel protein Shaw-like [Patella vulgata]|uniref:potassium voltage-gated channel protein Shaw-like n=1 Tax=Patella vulgata TaxID=6465 RepID=UPI00217FAA20|nr:potassium voltage-gated channel protein Shaw-like [Patella vulgata]